MTDTSSTELRQAIISGLAKTTHGFASDQLDVIWPLITSHIKAAEVAARLEVYINTSQVLKFVIEHHTFDDSLQAAKHWKKQTDKLIATLKAESEQVD